MTLKDKSFLDTKSHLFACLINSDQFEQELSYDFEGLCWTVRVLLQFLFSKTPFDLIKSDQCKTVVK